MSACLYLDTSAVLRTILENGTSPEVEVRIAAARALITSRLSLVESSRALTACGNLDKSAKSDSLTRSVRSAQYGRAASFGS
jgi:uncharacterized protein with PIN domain